MRLFLLSAVSSAVGLVLAGAAVALPPAKFAPGKLQRVEYIYVDAVGQTIGVKIYECSGWVISLGATSGPYDSVQYMPCP